MPRLELGGHRMSALIWLAIVGVWGFVLIPMWLRHHDGALEQRSADRFSTAMRVLSRRGGRAQPAPATVRGVIDVDVDVDVHVDVDDLDRVDRVDRVDLSGQPETEGVDEAADADDEMIGTAPESAPVSRLSGPRLDTGPAAQARSARLAATSGTASGSGRLTGQGRHPGGQATPPRAGTPAADGVALGDGEPDETAHTVAVGPTRPVPPARIADPRRRALLRLRRQRLLVLLAAVPITIGLAAGLAGMWIVVQLLVDVGLTVYLAHLRRSTRAERRLAASRAARDRRIATERAARRASRQTGAPPVSAGRPTAGRGSAAATSRAAADPRQRMAGGGSSAPTSARETSSASRSGAGHRAEPADGDFAGRPRVSSGQAGRLASPEYAPVRLSGDDGPPLTEEELATAHAQTVDLGGYVAAATVVAGASGGAETSPPATGEDETYTNNVRVTGARPAARPNARPSTSRPGRVQVNPPGTHGGLTAPPAAGGTVVAPPAVTSANAGGPGSTGAPAVGEPAVAGREEGGAAVHVLRPAVGS
ncbi:hypothetical protein BCD49_29185 [Pseudofrankia sp. EUN1h]|nr:hypothetical protein BCD49_29185 [Pseudofrankia sp. EUN1h]